jgi:hypothetical protein
MRGQWVKSKNMADELMDIPKPPDAGCPSQLSTLAPKMRLWARQGRLDRQYMMNDGGQRLAYYRASPPVYFFSHGDTKPSVYYSRLVDLKADPDYTTDAHIWTGSYDAPLPVTED